MFPNGQIGLAWMDNNPMFIEKPGVYVYDSPNFIFEKFVTVGTKQITLGNKQRIVVYDGEVGISYYKGKLTILSPSIHTYDDTDLIFIGFLSTQQQIIQLTETGKQFLSCDTRDFVELGIKSDVFYSIINPELTYRKIGNVKAVEQLIRETCIATLQAIVRNSDLNQIAQSKTVHAVSESAAQMNASLSTMLGQPSAPMFFDHLHDEFISKLHDDFSSKYGIEIVNIRIESFKILNDELSKNISNQALTTAKTQTQLDNLRRQTEIAIAEQERDSSVTRIKAEAEASKIKIETTTKNDNILAAASAKVREMKMLAEAEAESILIRSKAKAAAIVIEAEAEQKRAEMIGSTEIGKQMAIMNIQADMVSKSLQGTSKIFYLPYGSTMSDIPLKLLNLPTQ